VYESISVKDSLYSDLDFIAPFADVWIEDVKAVALTLSRTIFYTMSSEFEK